ncbi:MAG: AAC(3) family N-acetyltransferase [Clostridia bacterium]|nr:AAC(3) family N-acetyltransferase [Clostridia bacterium]
MITKQDIFDFLERNGIGHDRTVVVHTSMRKLGEVEGGCDGLIDAFCEYLSEGLFIVPTHTWNNVDENNPIYDVRETVPCIGALPTTAAFRKDGVRSLHPTHSVAAFGKRAAEFVKGEETSTSPCPEGGLWSRLYDEDAIILLLGVGLNSNTYIHAVDEELDLPERLYPPIPLTIVDYDGNKYNVNFQKHGLTGWQNFGVYKTPLEYVGAFSTDTLGNAEVGIFSAKKGSDLIKKLWSKAEYDLCKQPREEIPEEYYK